MLTRGKTARDRWHRLDTWIAREPALRLSANPLFIDFGFGAEPSATVESYRRLSVFTPGLRVLGVEIDADRVGNAYTVSIPGRLEFRFGGFDIPMAPGERASVVRAINVLRGCDEPRHHEAVNRLGRALRDGGVLMEGTGSPTGRLLAVSLYRRRGARLAREGLLLAPNLARDWTPRELQAVLPRDLIDHSGPGSWLDDFFERWDKCVTAARDRRPDGRGAFVAAAHELGDAIDHDPAIVRRGFILVRLPAAVGEPERV